jgi:stage IV sporulation protein FB
MFGTVAPTPFDLNFSIFGIPVRVHPFFWLAWLAMGWNPHDPNLMLIWVLCAFVSILVHELGHALTAQHFGWHPHVVLYAFGGYASFQPTWGHSTARSILVAFAGPWAGFMLYAVVIGIQKLLVHQGVHLSVLALNAFWAMKMINLWWGLVNLLPVYPLDGGQICRAALSHWRPYNGVDISLKLSLITAIGVALLAYHFHQINAALLFGVLAFENFQMLQGRQFR